MASTALHPSGDTFHYNRCVGEPAVPVTGEDMLICALVWEPQGQACLLGTRLTDWCPKRQLRSVIRLFRPKTKPDKHSAMKWWLWHEQSLPPSCFSSLHWQQHFALPHRTGHRNHWFTPQASLIHTSGQQLMLWLQGWEAPVRILPFPLKHLAAPGKGCGLHQRGRNKELAALVFHSHWLHKTVSVL